MSLVDLPVRKAQALQGRVVLVSGAQGGLGATSAQACAESGATVVLLGRKPAKLNRVYDACSKLGPEPLLYPLDLEGATPDDYAELADRLHRELGRLDGLLHCAAEFRGLTPLEHTDPANFARAVHVNLTAPWWLSQACLPLLKQSPDSALVFALDDMSRVGQAYWGGYGLAQHALGAMVGMLHAELATSTVRVAALQPGPMRTPLRAKAYADDEDIQVRDPADYAQACVTLLAPAGNAHRGEIWRVRA
ncbi:MAG: SDR family NAD(P)-dependent oxidoreductase [Comamonadaceae bacterium]|nr:MAG: SDR family NAD(P)-dependent oxidoreductase [Comamonadaceae bacterium]